MRALFSRWIDKWLFQLRGAESGEVFLHQRRVFILPTRPGLAFGVMLVLLLLGAINYNLSLGFALTFLIAGIAIVDLHLTFRNLAHLHLNAGRAPAVFAGADAQFELQVINRRKHDRYALWIGFIGPGLPDLPQPTDIAANSTSCVLLTAPTQERGWLAAPRVRLQTRFPLGLVRAWSYWQPAVHVLVYPTPEEHAPPLPRASDEREDGHGRFGQNDFAGIRAYQVGDSLKHLAWKQIAKIDVDAGGVLLTKQFEGGATSETVLDYATLPRLMDREMKLSRLTRWILDAELQGQPYAFRLGSISYPPACGAAHQTACLCALALYEGS